MTRTVRRKLMVIGATLFLLLGAVIVKAQNFPVRASVTIVNPSPYLEDYGRDGSTIIILTLVDNRPSYTGLLRLSLIGQNFEATTNEATFLGQPITLIRGVPLILRGPELAPYFDLNNLDVQGLIIDNTLRNGGRIPDGPITITAEFFDINRFDDPAVSNLGLATRFIQQNYPPELVAPLGEIPGQPTPVINFSWNPRHIPQPANDEYVLQVWKKVPGLTDDQIANSRGFQRRPIITRVPRYTYTNFDSRMEIGESYLWRVQVRDQRNVRQFVNNGYSEYGTFIYGLDDDPGNDDCLGPTDVAVSNIGETSADLNWSFPSGVAENNVTISTRITGQSTWQIAGTVPANITNYNLQNLSLATGYEVKVCSSCKSGEEDPCSAVAFVTPTPDCGPLPQPITYAVTNSNILVNWEHIPQAEGYVLNWRKIPNPGDPVEAQQAPMGVATDGETSPTAPSNNPGTSAPPPNTLILPAGSTEGTATGLAAGWNYAFKLCKDCPDGTQECYEWVEVFNGAVDYCSDDFAPYLTIVYGSETQTTLDLGWTLASAPSLPQGYSQTLTCFPTTVLGTTDTITLTNNQLSTTIEGLEVATEYTAEICVLCPDGNKLCSTVNGTTLPYACPDELELESGVVVTPVIPDGIKVDWTLFGNATITEGWSFALLNMAGDTLQRATAGVGFSHTFAGLDAEAEYRVAYCHECEDGTKNCAEETVYLTGCADAALVLETGMIHFDFIELSWQDAGAEKYTVTFSEQGSATSIGDPQTTENTDFTLGGLSPLTSYEISVCFECGATPVCDTIVVTTIGVNCALAGDYEYDFECGLNVSLQDPENQQLVETLNPGDSIWAGDFLVEIAEITGNTTFGGFGRTKIPYLAGAKLRLDFHEIQVNEDCRMVAGKMVVKSPLEAALEQLQQGLLDLQDLLGDIDLFLGNLSAGLGSVSDMLNELATAADVTDEANAVLDQLVTALDQVPYLPDSYVDAVEDAAECLRQAALTGTDDDVRDCRDQLLEAIQDAQDFIDDLFDADFIVDFAPTVPANAYWGLDSQRYDLITESYDQRTIAGTPYKVPWASTSTEEASGVPFGAVRRDGETMNPVNFIGSDTQPYPGWTKDGTSASNPGLYADGDQQVKVVFAAHDNPDAEEGNDSIPPVKLAGQLNVVTYAPVRHTVHIIPVNGAALTQDASAVEQAVNRIFRPAVAEWSVSIEPELTVPEFDGQLSDIPESLLSNYTPEMNLLKGKVKAQGYYDGDHYYLIVVPSMQEPGRLGFMPRKRSFGFLSAAQLTDGTTFNRTVAHELAHGAFHLQHVYDRFDGLSPGATDNLMDSGNGEELYKYQWDNVHDPESNFTLFDDEEEGESVAGVFFNDESILGLEEPPNCSSDTYLTPAGDIIQFPNISLLNNVVYYGSSGTCAYALRQFTYSGTTYKGIFTKKNGSETYNWFLGYYQALHFESLRPAPHEPVTSTLEPERFFAAHSILESGFTAWAVPEEENCEITIRKGTISNSSGNLGSLEGNKQKTLQLPSPGQGDVVDCATDVAELLCVSSGAGKAFFDAVLEHKSVHTEEEIAMLYEMAVMMNNLGENLINQYESNAWSYQSNLYEYFYLNYNDWGYSIEELNVALTEYFNYIEFVKTQISTTDWENSSKVERLVYMLSRLSNLELTDLSAELRSKALKALIEDGLVAPKLFGFINTGVNTEGLALRLIQTMPVNQIEECLKTRFVSDGVWEGLDEGFNEAEILFSDGNYFKLTQALILKLKLIQTLPDYDFITSQPGHFIQIGASARFVKEGGGYKTCEANYSSTWLNSTGKIQFSVENINGYDAEDDQCEKEYNPVAELFPYEWIVIQSLEDLVVNDQVVIEAGKQLIIPAYLLHYYIQEDINETIELIAGVAIDIALLATGVGELAAASRFARGMAILDVILTSGDILLKLNRETIISEFGQDGIEFMNTYAKVTMVTGIGMLATAGGKAILDNVTISEGRKFADFVDANHGTPSKLGMTAEEAAQLKRLSDDIRIHIDGSIMASILRWSTGQKDLRRFVDEMIASNKIVVQEINGSLIYFRRSPDGNLSQLSTTSVAPDGTGSFDDVIPATPTSVNQNPVVEASADGRQAVGCTSSNCKLLTCGCVIEGTLVKTRNHGFLPVEEIELGAEILSLGNGNEVPIYRKVEKIIRSSSSTFVGIDFPTERLTLTAGHPIIPLGQTGSLPAGSITTSHKIGIKADDASDIVNVSTSSLSQTRNTFDFYLAGFASYFVGKNSTVALPPNAGCHIRLTNLDFSEAQITSMRSAIGDDDLLEDVVDILEANPSLANYLKNGGNLDDKAKALASASKLNDDIRLNEGDLDIIADYINRTGKSPATVASEIPTTTVNDGRKWLGQRKHEPYLATSPNITSTTLPAGYTVFQRTLPNGSTKKYVRRVNANDPYTPHLTVDENDIVVPYTGPARMNNQAAFRSNMEALYGPMPLGHQRHHMVPVNVVATHPFYQHVSNMTDVSYTVDRGSNGKYMSASAENYANDVSGASLDYPTHNGSHSDYDQLINNKVDEILATEGIDPTNINITAAQANAILDQAEAAAEVILKAWNTSSRLK